jgi:hypothetical protein
VRTRICSGDRRRTEAAAYLHLHAETLRERAEGWHHQDLDSPGFEARLEQMIEGRRRSK